jgi:molybdopterin synthase catalytic subunit
LTTEPIDYEMLTAAVRLPSCGAVVTFLGTVRDLTAGQTTLALHYDAYVPLAEKQLHAIAAEVRQRWPIGGLAIVHRLGRLAVSEISVGIAVSCPHRAEAFAACMFAMDRIKEVVPIWKQEHGPDGQTAWVHPGSV